MLPKRLNGSVVMRAAYKPLDRLYKRAGWIHPAPLMMPAARKYQKFYARAEISAGTPHERMSKIRVVRLRPNLSVTTPLNSARTI